MTFHDDVGKFNEKFDLPRSDDGAYPKPLDGSTLAYRVGFLLEELCEFNRAASKDDLAGMLDALVDLCYVAMGTAHFLRLPFNEAWAEVQRANLSKERATSAGDDRSKRGHQLDVIKPRGWVSPDVAGVIQRHVEALIGRRKGGE